MRFDNGSHEAGPLDLTYAMPAMEGAVARALDGGEIGRRMRHTTMVGRGHARRKRL